MIIRQALFEGAIHDGREEAFKTYVAEKLLPLWLQFTDVREVRCFTALAATKAPQRTRWSCP